MIHNTYKFGHSEVDYKNHLFEYNPLGFSLKVYSRGKLVFTVSFLPLTLFANGTGKHN